MISELFKDRKILVTGHTGFKGSWLTLWLHHWGARVSGYALPPPTEPSNFDASRVIESMEAQTIGDIRDGNALADALDRSDPEILFHLAAQPLVRESYLNPRETFEVNVLGTVNLLDAVRKRRRPCVVLSITSDKCYENREQVWGYRESDPMGGHDPYSASKGAAELVISSYRRSFFPPDRIAEHGVKLASARAGNVIGGGDWAAERIVPDLARAWERGEPVRLRNPQAVRPWQHVLDPLHGYLTLAARLLGPDPGPFCDGWNFAPAPTDDLVTVGALADRFGAAAGMRGWVQEGTPQPHEAHMLRLSVDQAVTRLGWRPTWGVEQAVARTVDWYRRFQTSPQEMREACLDDLDQFLRDAGRQEGRSNWFRCANSRSGRDWEEE